MVEWGQFADGECTDMPMRPWIRGQRWFAAGYLETEKHFRRIMGYEHLWVLKAKLHELRELRLERLRSTSTVSVGNPLTQEAA